LRSVFETALDTAGKERLAELAEMVRKGVIKVRADPEHVSHPRCVSPGPANPRSDARRGQRCVGRTPEARTKVMSTKSARWVRLAAAALLVVLVSPAPARADAVSMTARRDFPVGSVSINVALGDFNGDGVADLAVANYLAGTVSVLLGNGDGTYRPALSVPVGANPWAIAVGDF